MPRLVSCCSSLHMGGLGMGSVSSEGMMFECLLYCCTESDRMQRLLVACSAGWDLFLLSIDEGISGYRDDSLATVQENEIEVRYHMVTRACFQIQTLFYDSAKGAFQSNRIERLGDKDTTQYFVLCVAKP